MSRLVLVRVAMLCVMLVDSVLQPFAGTTAAAPVAQTTGSNKFIVDAQNGANGIVPYLPLNDLPKTPNAPARTNSSLSGAPPLQSTGASRTNPNGTAQGSSSLSNGGQEASQ